MHMTDLIEKKKQGGELTDEEMDEYGIELCDDCSYFVPEEDYEEAYELAEERMRKSIEG